MKPKTQEPSPQADMFRSRLDNIINLRHELVKLSQAIAWDFLRKKFLLAMQPKDGQASPRE